MKKILILPGWSYSTDKWQTLVEKLSSDEIRVEVLAIPGLHEEISNPWTLQNYVEWLKKIAEQQKDRLILIGHSNGGRIALSFCHQYPDYLEKLIIIDSAGIYHNGLFIRTKRFTFRLMAKIGKRLTSSKILRNFLYRLAREKDYQHASINLRKTMQNLISIDLKPILKEVRTPVLIIWGANDRITPVSDAKYMKEALPNSTLKIIQNARHSPQFTNTDEVVNLVTKFIE